LVKVLGTQTLTCPLLNKPMPVFLNQVVKYLLVILLQLD
jgi:hypothetical protein